MTGEVAYFQTGTYGPASDSVLQAVRETMEREARHGPATTLGRQAHGEREAAARSGLARMLNVKEEELSIDTNTSRAMQQIVRGLNWQPGDEFVMTSLEHVSTYGLSYSLTEEHGVTIKVLEVENPDRRRAARRTRRRAETSARASSVSAISPPPTDVCFRSKRQPPSPIVPACPSSSTWRSPWGRCRSTSPRSTVTSPSVPATNGCSAQWEPAISSSLNDSWPTFARI